MLKIQLVTLLKNVTMDLHLVRERTENATLLAQYISSYDQWTDILKKNLVTKAIQRITRQICGSHKFEGEYMH